MMLKKLVILLGIQIIFSCSETKTIVEDNQCNKIDIVCTENFITISIEIVDSNDNPVTLDSFKVIQKNTGKDISNNANLYNNYYPIVDDSYQHQLENKEQTFIFMGFKDNKEVVKETYVIAADCCHIYLVSGKTKITLS